MESLHSCTKPSICGLVPTDWTDAKVTPLYERKHPHHTLLTKPHFNRMTVFACMRIPIINMTVSWPFIMQISLPVRQHLYIEMAPCVRHWCLLEGDEHIQCGARSQFSHKYSQKSPHSSPIRVRYGLSFMDPASDGHSTSDPVIIHVISYNTGPHYNGTTVLWKHILHHNIDHFCNMSSGMPCHAAHNNKVYVDVNILSFSCTLNTAHHQYTLKKLQSNISYKSHLSRQWNCDNSDVVGAQLHLHAWLNTLLQWIWQRHLQVEMRNIQVLGLCVSY